MSKFFQSFLIVGLTGLTTLATLNVRISPTFSQANYSAKPHKITFSCQEIFDEASGKSIPATVAWIPERRGSVRFISWRPEYFIKSGWTSQERCQKVTEKFQHLYTQGSFAYLSHGMHTGIPIICGLAEQGETCDGNTQLFTIKPGFQPKLVLQRLMDITEQSTIICECSDIQMYITVDKFLKVAPLIKPSS